MKKVIFTLAGLPVLIVVITIVLVVGVFSSDAAHQACVYGEGTKQGQKVYNGSATSSAIGSTGAAGVVGMDEAAAEAWFGGQQGPGNFCATYAYGQCTWWTCMRAKKIGWKGVGQYWGNGKDWARSAASAGYRTTTSLPVAGSIISWPPGVQGSDPVYGHVGIVESVDTSHGTITTSEKGAGYKVYSKTYPIVNGGTYVLPNDAISGTASGGPSGNLIEVKETKKANGRYEVNVAAKDRPSQCSASDSPFDYAPPSDAGDTSSGTIPGGAADPNGIHASAENAKKYARAHLKDHGWNDLEFIPLENLWTRESGWQWNATNPSSGAYGIPQSLPATKMSSAGSDWHDNAYTQINWGFSYIAQRYGSPSAAWNHSQQTGWY